jgi:sporadic carbohydrate cluster protein (TIGR04323 family)
MKKLRGYIFSRPFYGERVPQNIQNLVIRNYCEKNSFIYLLSIVEYCIEETFLNLNLAISQLKNCDGIVAYSLFQLPANQSKRKEIVLKTLKAKKEIHFALENMKILKLEDYYKISDILNVKKTLFECPKIL